MTGVRRFIEAETRPYLRSPTRRAHCLGSFAFPTNDGFGVLSDVDDTPGRHATWAVGVA